MKTKRGDTLDNKIINRENSRENILKLASQNRIYSKAKRILGLQIITQVVLTITLSLLPMFITDSVLTSINIKKSILVYL
ncbi:S-4TM family putative pore-forming effector [Clostridium botulinum]|uniref:S-4TM family putative pore-forming effector n=1 Tax=Clostridium botulinum TaxID=1491 RepID=UPI001A91BF33|nr:S-4TM family putative pore-forming effector [Clostridium botulinum]